MYCIKVRLDHQPNFMIILSLFTDIFISIVPLDWRECLSTICSMITCVYSTRARTDALIILLICTGFLPHFVLFVYTTDILSLLVPPLIRVWWTRSYSALTGKDFQLVRDSWWMSWPRSPFFLFIIFIVAASDCQSGPAVDQGVVDSFR